MSSEKIERVPPCRPLQASLPFDGDQDDATVSSTAPVVVQGVEPRVFAVGVPCLDPGDPDADLEAMTNEDLRRYVDRLKASNDRRPAVTIRLLKAIGILNHRGLSRPREVRCALVDVPATGPERSRASARWRFLRLLRRVGRAATAASAETLAEFLAEDFIDSGSIGMFREIAGGIREGLVDPQVVRAAYRAAKKPGVRKPGALLWAAVTGRSPQFAGWLAERRRARIAGSSGRRRR